MKRIFITLTMVFFCVQLSTAQQIINTNQKSTCTYNGTPELQSCADVVSNTTFTFKENNFLLILTTDGVNTNYTIESKAYEAPYWKYRINDGNGTSYDLWSDQKAKEFNFCPTTLANGVTVIRYRFN